MQDPADSLLRLSFPVSSEAIRGYPCLCCGFLTLSDQSNGSYEICPVCFWEDDPVQNQDPFFSSGANQVSLIQARRNFVDLGAAEVRSLAHVRGPKIDEVPPAPTLSLDSELWQVKDSAVKIALLGTVRSIKTGAIALLEGCTAVSSLSLPVKADGPLEESLRIFKGVASEIDDMPTGRVRELWSAAALADKDAQMAEYEKRVRPAVLDGCDRLEAALLAGLKTGGTIGI